MDDTIRYRLPFRSFPTLCLAAGLFVALLLPARAPAATATTGEGGAGDEPPRFGGETTVTAVEVPVRVTLHGQPVRGLTAESFRLIDGGVERPLVGFEELDWAAGSPDAAGSAPGARRAEAPPAAGAPTTPPTPEAERRHFLFLFDLGFTAPAYLAQAERAARKLLEGELHPDDRVGVAFYSPGRGAGLVLQFTSDRAAVEAVLDRLASYLRGGRLDGAEPGGSVTDPLGITAKDWQAALGTVGREEEFGTNDFAQPFGTQAVPGPGPGPVGLDESLAESAGAFEEVYREREATRIAWMTDELSSLVRRLAGVEGPRYLVFLSGGYDVGLADPMTNWSGATDPGAGFWLLEQLEDLVDQVRRSGWVIYGVQLGAASADERHRGSLFHLAHETGGELLERFNDPADAFDVLLERTSSTYLLTFQAPDLPADGSYHPIRVELVGAPSGARIRYREGYQAPRPWSALDAAEKRLGAGAALLADRRLDDLRVSVGASVGGTLTGSGTGSGSGSGTGSGGVRRKVPVVVEVGGPSLLGETLDGELALEIYGYAFGPSGEIGDYFTRSVAFDVGKVATPLQQGGLRWIDELDLAPGPWEIRVLVQGSPSGHRGLRSVRLDVPATGGGPRLLAPFFLAESATGWLLASGSSGDDAYPFTVGGRKLVPAVDPTARAGHPMRLVVPGLDLDPASPAPRSLSARVVDAAGEPVAGGRLEWLVREPASPGWPDVLIGQLTTDDLPPGEYRLEIALAGEGGAPVSARFRVAPGPSGG